MHISGSSDLSGDNAAVAYAVLFMAKADDITMLESVGSGDECLELLASRLEAVAGL